MNGKKPYKMYGTQSEKCNEYRTFCTVLNNNQCKYYSFMLLMYKIVSINAPIKVMRFFYYFFLIGGVLGTAMLTCEFIGGFPNGLSPTLGACGALIISTLDSAKKNIENKN